MRLRRTRIQNIALTMLVRDGVSAIWELHLAAARAYIEGNEAAAISIIQIADAAEREWLQGKGAPEPTIPLD